MDFKWTKILGGAGALIGIFAAVNKGIMDLMQIIGYALGLTIMLLILGVIFDLVGSKFGGKD